MRCARRIGGRRQVIGSMLRAVPEERREEGEARVSRRKIRRPTTRSADSLSARQEFVRADWLSALLSADRASDHSWDIDAGGYFAHFLGGHFLGLRQRLVGG